MLLAIGALAKGPVAPALAVLVVGAYAVLRRDAKIFIRSISVPGFIFFCHRAAVVLAVQHNVPQFFRVFFIEHNLERFGTNLVSALATVLVLHSCFYSRHVALDGICVCLRW